MLPLQIASSSAADVAAAVVAVAAAVVAAAAACNATISQATRRQLNDNVNKIATTVLQL